MTPVVPAATEAVEAAAKLRLSPASYFFLGLFAGLPGGFFYGRKFAKEKLRVEIMEEAEKEVESMRKHFDQREIALRQQLDRRTAEEIADERGYSMKTTEGEVRVLRPPVPVQEPREDAAPTPQVIEGPQSVFTRPTHATGAWDFKKEISNRTGTRPYVVHVTEVAEDLPGYEQVTYEYYPVDDVLVDEDGQVIENRASVVGDALDFFGHGSGDPNVVFVRNVEMHLHIEIMQLPGRSHAEDVDGLSDDAAS